MVHLEAWDHTTGSILTFLLASIVTNGFEVVYFKRLILRVYYVSVDTLMMELSLDCSDIG